MFVIDSEQSSLTNVLLTMSTPAILNAFIRRTLKHFQKA